MIYKDRIYLTPSFDYSNILYIRFYMNSSYYTNI